MPASRERPISGRSTRAGRFWVGGRGGRAVKRSSAPLSIVALLAILLGACAPAAPAAAPRAPPAAKPAPAAGAAAQNPAAPPSDYFAGKTITAVVNFSAGGPTDIFARMVVAHLDKHIPGRPKIIVDNKAGAGGVIGANQLFSSARKDGL